MDLAPEDLEFRREVLSFLEEHLSADVRRASRLSTGVFVDPPWPKEWHQALFRKGWFTHAWPREYGGCGWSPIQRYIYDSEASLCVAPAVAPMGINLLGPVICEIGRASCRERGCQ